MTADGQAPSPFVPPKAKKRDGDGAAALQALLAVRRRRLIVAAANPTSVNVLDRTMSRRPGRSGEAVRDNRSRRRGSGGLRGRVRRHSRGARPCLVHAVPLCDILSLSGCPRMCGPEARRAQSRPPRSCGWPSPGHRRGSSR
jgi:hypothetical protein